MDNKIDYKLEDKEELYENVEQGFELIKAQRSESNKAIKTNTGETDTDETNIDKKYVKELEGNIKTILKILYKDRVTKTNEGIYITQYIRGVIKGDKVYNYICMLLSNSRNIAYRSYLAKMIVKKYEISKGEAYAKINELILFNVIENIDKSVRFTSTMMTKIFKIKNYRHSEVPSDMEAHTKLYFNLIAVGYRNEKEEKIINTKGCTFGRKRAIVIDEHTLLYRNRNYLDAEFFLRNSSFKTIYVLSEKLVKLTQKECRTYEVKLLEDAIDYEEY